MEIFRHVGEVPFDGTIVTMGNFDGIHLGHQALLRNTLSDARRMGYPAVVLTFEPHPLKILAPARAPRLLLAHKDKMRLFQSFGIDAVVIQPFDQRFARVEADAFVSEFLLRQLKVKKLWVGQDLRFGHGRKGNVDDLLRWGKSAGFEVGTVEPIFWKGARISSSRIRRLIEEGRVEEARPMLGRYHFLAGRVVRGNRRGRELGYPTANLATRTEVVPPDGIYATLLELGERSRPSVTSIGTNPTFGEGPRTIECYVLDFEQDIYGKEVCLSLVRRLRDEQKFASTHELTAQIARDVEAARAVFAELGIHGPS